MTVPEPPPAYSSDPDLVYRSTEHCGQRLNWSAGKDVLEHETGHSTVPAVRQLHGPPGLILGTRKDAFSHLDQVGVL